MDIMKIKFYLDILIICMFVSHLYSVAADFILMQKTNWFSLILSAVCYYQMTNMNTVYPELIEKWKSDLKK